MPQVTGDKLPSQQIPSYIARFLIPFFFTRRGAPGASGAPAQWAAASDSVLQHRDLPGSTPRHARVMAGSMHKGHGRDPAKIGMSCAQRDSGSNLILSRRRAWVRARGLAAMRTRQRCFGGCPSQQQWTRSPEPPAGADPLPRATAPGSSQKHNARVVKMGVYHFRIFCSRECHAWRTNGARDIAMSRLSACPCLPISGNRVDIPGQRSGRAIASPSPPALCEMATTMGTGTGTTMTLAWDTLSRRTRSKAEPFVCGLLRPDESFTQRSRAGLGVRTENMAPTPEGPPKSPTERASRKGAIAKRKAKSWLTGRPGAASI